MNKNEARVTLRIPEKIRKAAKIEAAKSDQSLNSWIVKVIQEKLNKEGNMLHDEIDNIFGRKTEDGNISLHYEADGLPVTRLEIPKIYPVGSSFSSMYEHPEGIILTPEDAQYLGVEIEN